MLSVVKTDEQRRARELRALGWSIGEIERELGVSRASASLWVRNVALNEAATARLCTRVGLGPRTSADRSRARARATRAAYQQEGRRLANERDVQYAAGCMLYWAEGAKARNSLKVINADPEVLVFFARFLRQQFGVPDQKMRVFCNLFTDHIERQRAIEDFWLQRLDLPRACLRKTIVNSYSKYSQKKRKNRLPYGTTALVVHSTRIQQTILGSIQEYGGFERPEWLD
jgi:transcriptional regulator with XRE-family HTH domain